MSAYTRLTDDAVRNIAETYFSERRNKTQPQEYPTHALVGGQPGAGKSAVSEMVRDELKGKGGAIHVDADRMRELLPINRLNPPSSEQTQADAGRLVSALRELATTARRNIVEEGTFRSPENAEGFIQGRKDQGYRVELLAVATSHEVSRLGIYQRHEQQHAVGAANPRMVPDKYHDDAMQGFDKTVDKVAGSLDRVRVVTRDATLLFDSESRSNTYNSAQQALAAGRTLNAENLAVISKTWTQIEKVAQSRGASVPYIEAVREHAQRTQAMQKALERDHGAPPQESSQKRAEAFRTMPEADALAKHPELKPAYQALKDAHNQFTARNPGMNASVGQAVMQNLREKMAERLQAGELVKPVELDVTRQQARPAERER